MKMIAKNKSEWFILDKPIGEPDVAAKWKEDTYWIERIVNNNGDIIWFGQGVNWQKLKGGKWTILGEDETVKPISVEKCPFGGGDTIVYPEGRQIWIECETPIYEKLYLELRKSDKDSN